MRGGRQTPWWGTALPLHHPNSTWRGPPAPRVPPIFPQLLLSSRQDLSVHEELPSSPQALWVAQPFPVPSDTSQWLQVLQQPFPSWALHRAPPAPRGTCLSLLSCPVQWGWECSQPSDELNLPDRLDLPLVPRDAFTSSWLWQRQTCSDTLAVAQSHSPRVICFSLSLRRARREVCTDKPILISSPRAPPSQGLHLCSSSRYSMTALFNKDKGVPVAGEFSANQMLWI